MFLFISTINNASYCLYSSHKSKNSKHHYYNNSKKIIWQSDNSESFSIKHNILLELQIQPLQELYFHQYFGKQVFQQNP